MARLYPYSPSDLNYSRPNFPREFIVWATKAQLEITAAVAATNMTIVESKELLTEVDRVLARR